MRADRDRSMRAREPARASAFSSAFALVEGDEWPAPEFVSQLVDVSQELADVIASANADVE
jgi:hypothetical protein